MNIQQTKLKFAYDHTNDLITDKLLSLGVRASNNNKYYPIKDILPDCKWIFLWEGVFSYYKDDDTTNGAEWKSECEQMTLEELNALIIRL